ncbi:hypothetical protein SAMD00019534_119380 [Acytostelium subglobosum LB1]|uniref:hypothetical protein n=1 Tax=Acytostelium subglobosum LB1 TaxID=1410327 RepID=UPI0006448265|nr:hypothetical protein SAMD00019534_119380 [Acytostelium subglobosum LB1]GAM28762.1 hypothetical protein SAMD00019534_119380 [Acytostelium subglobosum LB1]|eukprot:XP_012748317.1 hypothetical protein SAMD00019534_119380 [Acytostelium subglobosum LB1]
MLYLIFPKLFEFYKFLSYLLHSDYCVVNDIKQVDAYEYRIFLYRLDRSKQRQSSLQLPIYLINDSDINFYGIFSKLATNPDHTYILIGSCGSGNLEDFGNLHVVERAVKGDRGRLDARQLFTYETDSKKITSRQHCLWPADMNSFHQSGMELRQACSTNFMNTNIITESFKNYLFDMETFDFYDICTNQSISMYSCVRFVTDYVIDLGKSEPTTDVYYGMVSSKKAIEDQFPDQLLEKLKDLPLSSAKKLIRLRLKFNFDFVFNLHLENNLLKTDHPFKPANVEKYYDYFNREYRNKIQTVLPDFLPTAGGANKNFRDSEALLDLENKQTLIKIIQTGYQTYDMLSKYFTSPPGKDYPKGEAPLSGSLEYDDGMENFEETPASVDLKKSPDSNISI